MTSLKRKDYGMLDNNLNSFNNMIDSFFNDDFLKKGSVFESTFKVDVSEDENGYLVEAELPGFNKDEINVSLEDGNLLIEAERNEDVDSSDEDRKYIHKERKSTKMTRSMYFGDIDESKINAKLEDGLLKIRLNKNEVKDKKKQIAID